MLDNSATHQRRRRGCNEARWEDALRRSWNQSWRNAAPPRAERGGIFVEVFNILPFIPKHRPRSARPRNGANASSRPGDSWVRQTEASHHPATDDSRSMSTPTKLSPYKMRPPMRSWETHARG